MLWLMPKRVLILHLKSSDQITYVYGASRRVSRAGACGRLPVLSGAVGSVRGAAGAIVLWREGGRLLVDGHFSARTSAALPPPPFWMAPVLTGGLF